MTKHSEPWNVPHSAATVDDALRGWASSAPDLAALRHGDEQWTYGRLDGAVEHACRSLLKRGITRGDRVVIVGDNSCAWIIVYLAVLRAGAVAAPANNRINTAQFGQQCALLDAALVLHDTKYSHLADATPYESADLHAFVTESHHAPSTTAPLAHRSPEPDDIALISFSSGTTGVPKGVVISHGALLASSALDAEFLRSTSDDSTLLLVPLFHNTGFVDQLGHMLVVGGCTNILSRYRTADAVAEFRARPVSLIVAVPSILRLLMMDSDADAVFGQVRALLFGGSPMPASWSDELRTRWPEAQLVHAYGLTEFTSICSFLPPDLTSTGESVGFAAPGVELRVVDDSGNAAPTGAVGEIQVCGPTRMTEYWRRPDLTARAFAGQWLRTGDLGRFDDDGLLWLAGRVDDVINRGGEKVLPAFVESCVAGLDEVAECIVFAAADPVLQSRVACAVRIRSGAELDEASARTRLLESLPDYAVPEIWVHYDTELPRASTGKIDRKQIQSDYAAQ